MRQKLAAVFGSCVFQKAVKLRSGELSDWCWQDVLDVSHDAFKVGIRLGRGLCGIEQPPEHRGGGVSGAGDPNPSMTDMNIWSRQPRTTSANNDISVHEDVVGASPARDMKDVGHDGQASVTQQVAGVEFLRHLALHCCGPDHWPSNVSWRMAWPGGVAPATSPVPPRSAWRSRCLCRMVRTRTEARRSAAAPRWQGGHPPRPFLCVLCASVVNRPFCRCRRAGASHEASDDPRRSLDRSERQTDCLCWLGDASRGTFYASCQAVYGLRRAFSASRRAVYGGRRAVYAFRRAVYGLRRAVYASCRAVYGRRRTPDSACGRGKNDCMCGLCRISGACAEVWRRRGRRFPAALFVAMRGATRSGGL